jgi:hypothetical protein
LGTNSGFLNENLGQIGIKLAFSTPGLNGPTTGGNSNPEGAPPDCAVSILLVDLELKRQYGRHHK